MRRREAEVRMGGLEVVGTTLGATQARSGFFPHKRRLIVILSRRHTQKTEGATRDDSGGRWESGSQGSQGRGSLVSRRLELEWGKCSIELRGEGN